eukprot:TRINITY_DN81545_c0_g1_i1.p1 TRINITY_DN81545_c0_g1~~TRINITY_DN81545_c0_g1_i1.p1  ORF type:complete len:351 (+),score=52.67 TRINITY_DN81545_c0_g1_i1:25-1053(+)
MLLGILGLVPVILLLAAVFRQSKTVSAICQLGSVQERIQPWSGPPRAEKLSRGIRNRDKAVFTLGVANLALTCYLIGVAPTNFYLWHTPKAIGLTVLRWWEFRQTKQHYLLYDFCYWLNLLSLIYVWVLPESETTFQILFMLSNGPLAWSILAFSQSLVFHSPQHMTSVFIHLSPVLLVHGIRWNASPRFAVCANFPTCDDVAPLTLVWNAVTRFYVWWIVLYYIWVFVVLGRRVRQRGYQTLFDRVVKKGPMRWILRVHPHELVQKGAYVLVHFCFALLTVALAVFYWYNYWVHLAFIAALGLAASWNAAGYYFTVFLEYEETLRQRVEKHDSEKRQKNAA